MNIDKYIEAVVEADDMPVVICGTDYNIIYMNKSAAKRYEKRGGYELVGKSIFDCHNERSCEIIRELTEKMKCSADLNKIFLYNSKRCGDEDEYLIALRDKNGSYIGFYEKHESRIYEQKG